MENEIVKHESGDIAVSDMLSTIIKAVANPALDVVKMQALLDMHKQIVSDQRKIAFASAMSRLQAVLPQIGKFGQAKNSKFAKLEDIDVVIRPLLANEGFSFSFDEESHTDKTVTFVAVLSHGAGHSESKRLTVPIDAAAKNREGHAIRPAIQDSGSTVSYARRYLIKMHLNIIEKNEDNNGDNLSAITTEEVRNIETLLGKGDKSRFLKLMGVATIAEILTRDYRKALNALQTKGSHTPPEPETSTWMEVVARIESAETRADLEACRPSIDALKTADPAAYRTCGKAYNKRDKELTT